MTIEEVVSTGVANALHDLYGLEADASKVNPSPTRKDFEGDLTVMVFPYLKASHKSPEATGAEIGQWLVDNVPAVSSFNVVKGFLNLSITSNHWLDVLNGIAADPDFGIRKAGDDAPLVMVE